MATEALPVPAAPRLRVGRCAGYVFTGFPLAVATFVLLIAGFAVGIGTLAITIGIVVLAGTLAAARTLARVERGRLDALLGFRTPRPAYRTPRGGRLGRAVSAGADPRRWLDLLHGIVAFPVAVATFAIVVRPGSPSPPAGSATCCGSGACRVTPTGTRWRTTWASATATPPTSC